MILNPNSKKYLKLNFKVGQNVALFFMLLLCEISLCNRKGKGQQKMSTKILSFQQHRNENLGQKNGLLVFCSYKAVLEIQEG